MEDCVIEDFADDFGEPERKDEMTRMPPCHQDGMAGVQNTRKVASKFFF